MEQNPGSPALQPAGGSLRLPGDGPREPGFLFPTRLCSGLQILNAPQLKCSGLPGRQKLKTQRSGPHSSARGPPARCPSLLSNSCLVHLQVCFPKATPGSSQPPPPPWPESPSRPQVKHSQPGSQVPSTLLPPGPSWQVTGDVSNPRGQLQGGKHCPLRPVRKQAVRGQGPEPPPAQTHPPSPRPLLLAGVSHFPSCPSHPSLCSCQKGSFNF